MNLILIMQFTDPPASSSEVKMLSISDLILICLVSFPHSHADICHLYKVVQK